MTDAKQDKHTKPETEDLLKKLQEEMKALTVELEQTKSQIEEYKTKYLRALADYQNFEKRVLSQREELISNANRHLILKLLTFLDNLDKAEVFVKDDHLKLIRDSFQKLLKEEGLEELEVIEKEYDPYTAEVVDITEGDKDNTVVEVYRKGYGMNGRILRVAQVKVSKKKMPDKAAHN